jgi:Uma2 family endonuclease
LVREKIRMERKKIMQITDKTYFYTAEQFHLVRDLAGNFFEQVEGQIVWRQTGQAVEEEILEAIFNHQDVIIEYMTTKEHAWIIANISDSLRSVDRNLFKVFSQDPCICIMIDGFRLRTRIPDVTVIPKQPKCNELGETLNPLVIFEVISPGSVKTDYIEKLREYKFVDSLQDYLIVEQKSMQITHYQKVSKTEWIERNYDNKEDTINLNTVAVTIPIVAIYENVL